MLPHDRTATGADPEPLRPEEVEPVGQLIAERFQKAARAYGETGGKEKLLDMIGLRFALEDHVREFGPVLTDRGIYKINGQGELSYRSYARKAPCR